MPDISRLVIEVDSKGVVTATGNMAAFEAMSKKVGKGADDLANKLGAFHLIANKLPSPLKSIASGLMGLVSPSTAAISSVMEFAKVSWDCIEMVREQEAQFARLGAVMEATGASAWTSASDLQNLADSLRRLTGRSSNEILQMQSVLLGFTDISGENFERLTRGMINMADVMGGGLVASANTFGRALENPAQSLNALTRQGFVFTEEQKRMVKALDEAGDKQGAQVVFLEAMERAFGNSAEAVRQARGATINWKLAVEDLKLEFGKFMDSKAIQWLINDAAAAINLITSRFKGSNELREFENVLATYQSGLYTNEQAVWLVDEYDRLFFTVKDGIPVMKSLDAVTSANFNTWSAALKDLIKDYDKYSANIKKANEEEKERNRLLKNREELNKIIGDIDDAYANTDEGRANKLQTEIDKYLLMKETMREVQAERMVGTYQNRDGNIRPILETYTKMAELTDEQKRRIDVIVEGLQKQKDGVGKITKEYDAWVKLLSQATGFSEELVKKLGGMGTLDKFSSGLESIIGRYDEGLMKILGLNQSDVFDQAADQIRQALSSITEGVDSEGNLLDQFGFDEQSTLVKELIKLIEELDIKTKSARQSEAATSFDEELKKRQEQIWMTEEQIRLEEYKEKFGNKKGVELFNFEKEIEKVENLRDALKSLKNSMVSLMGSGFLDFTSELGRAFRQGADFSESFNGALRNMLRSMIDAMPQLLLNVGLQLIPKNLALGLAFIGASGLMSFVSGMIGDAGSQSQKDEAERLRNIQQQLLDLITSQRQQQEYYMTQKRKLNSTPSMSVNDAIITPRGVVHTHPEDYIIATKRPQDLMSGGGSKVIINVQPNNATVTTTETTNADGTKQIEMIVKGIIGREISNGGMDEALDAMNRRRSGTRRQQG